jgi:hypothetical protein
VNTDLSVIDSETPDGELLIPDPDAVFTTIEDEVAHKATTKGRFRQ